MGQIFYEYIVLMSASYNLNRGEWCTTIQKWAKFNERKDAEQFIEDVKKQFNNLYWSYEIVETH